jgi:hypothetical protein
MVRLKIVNVSAWDGRSSISICFEISRLIAFKCRGRAQLKSCSLKPEIYGKFYDVTNLEIEVCVLRQQQLQDFWEAADGGFVCGTLAVVVGGVDGRSFLDQILRNFRLPVQTKKTTSTQRKRERETKKEKIQQKCEHEK